MAKNKSFAPKQAGFSLLEVLVAFSILALALGVFLNIFGGGARNVAVTEEYVRATILAESQMALIGTAIVIEETELEGEFDDKYRWFLEIAPYELVNNEGETDFLSPENYPVEPYLVKLDVEWGDENNQRILTIETLRMLPRGVSQ